MQNALAQRRRNMIWELVADYTFIFFYSVVFAGVIACLIYLALLIYADQQHLFAISGIGAFILFVTAIAIWAIRKIILRNRQARKIAWSCLTQASQTAAPSDKAIILNASYTLAPNLEPDCRMDICDDYEAEDVPLQLPRHWAAQMETNDLAYIPTRVFPVTGSGKVAIFSPQIRGYDTGTVWRRMHRNAIHLQDAGYIMLSIGNFSMHDEMSAGIPPPNYSASIRNGYMWKAGVGGAGLFLCLVYAFEAYPDLALGKLMGCISAFILCLTPMITAQTRYDRFLRKVRQFYGQRGVPFCDILDTDTQEY